MAQIGLSEAAEKLRDYFGSRLDAGRDDGPDRMVDALVESFHISKGDAKKIVDDLIKAGSVRYQEGNPAGDRDYMPEGTVAAQSGTGIPAGLGGLARTGGYWQFK